MILWVVNPDLRSNEVGLSLKLHIDFRCYMSKTVHPEKVTETVQPPPVCRLLTRVHTESFW